MMLVDVRQNFFSARTSLLLFCLMFFMRNVFALPLTLDSVLKSVDKHYPTITNAQIDIEKAQANLIAAKGGFDPRIRSNLVTSPIGKYSNIFSNTELIYPVLNSGNQIFTGYRIGRGEFPVYDQDRWTYDYGEFRVGVDVPLLRDKKIDERRAKIQSSQLQLSINNQEYELQRLDVFRNAAYGYWDWVGEGQKVILMQLFLKLAKDRQAIIDERVHRGDLPQLDSVENARLVIQRQRALEEQFQVFQKASLLLSLYFRDENKNPIKSEINQLPHNVSEKLNELFEQRMPLNLEGIIESHPGIKKIQEERAVSYVDISLAKNLLLPRLSNRVYVAQDMGPGAPPLNKTNINYELAFELPLYQREARGKILAAEKSLQKIDIQKQFLIDNITVGIKNALNQLSMTEKVSKMTREEVKLAKNLEEAEKIKYLNGDSNLFLVNQREVSTIETEMRLWAAIIDYHKAFADYHYSTATPITEHLEGWIG